ncbi:B-cell receptor CD22-like isoform X1 [Corythoichthys intestinalis]|uniref:B-cell receptor CD22-like isoform X1 n=2 Tax=Corythoichthys intestinalis TaxID=161448 RepID=UPI0025A5E27B|nr:B-cell receptor CD22-like isoform X1 [Corythoichthys intestinalis]
MSYIVSRKYRMSWTAQKDIVILVILLFGFQVSQSWEPREWGGTFTQETICGLTGTTVTLTCSIRYPQRHDGQIIKVIKGLWYTKVSNRQPQDLTMDPQYSGRLDQNCQGNFCTLSIKKLRESDQGTYKLRFITNVDGGEYTLKTGVTLDVTAARVQVIKTEEIDSYTFASLSCHTSCSPAASLSWCWKRKPQNDDCLTHHWRKEEKIYLRPGENITCAVEGYPLSASPPLYALEAPRVLSTKDEIMEGDSLTLTCRADTPTSSGHRWCKKTGTSYCEVMSYGEYLVFSSIQSSDSAVYCCVVENDLGQKMSQPFVNDVKYAPRSCSLLVDPIKEIEEGNQVTLTCSCDANPAARFTWYKGQTRLGSSERNYVFNSIRPEDCGSFYCKAYNKYGDVTSDPVFINVQYVPRLPSISAIPSSNVRKGSSVNLTCSSDANPAASYFWFKDNEETPNSTGAVLNIINFQIHNEGTYHCEARNIRGSQNATLLVQAENFRSWSQGAAVAVRCATVGIMLILLSVTVLLFWKKTTSKGRMHLSQPNTSEDSSRDQLEELVAFSDPSPIHANVTNDKTDQDENEYESVVDTVIKCGGQASG